MKNICIPILVFPIMTWKVKRYSQDVLFVNTEQTIQKLKIITRTSRLQAKTTNNTGQPLSLLLTFFLISFSSATKTLYCCHVFSERLLKFLHFFTV